MTLKEIKEHYRVYRNDDGSYNLHTLEPVKTSRTVYKFLCTIFRKGQSFYIDGYKPVNTIFSLLDQIDDYLEKLPYDSEYYCPTYRKGFAQECFIIDRFSEYGFSNHNWRSEAYSLNRESIYGYSTTKIDIFHDVDEQEEKITFHLSTGNYSGVRTSCGFDFKEIHNTIDGLIKPLLLTEGIQNIQLSEKMVNNDVELILQKLKGFDVTTSKIDLKAKLLELADSL